MPRIRLSDADRERYGGPEWVEIDMATLLDEETGLIEAIEESWDLTIGEFTRLLARESQRALRIMFWAARRRAGCTDDPRTWRPSVMPWTPGLEIVPTKAEDQAAAEVLAAAAGGDAGPPDEAPINRAGRRAGRRAESGS